MLTWLVALAHAQLMPHGHVVPDAVRLHDDLRYVRADGASKTADCDEALAAAHADLRARLKPGEVVVAIWPYKGRTAWEPTPDVECVPKGKKATVTMEALVSHPGPAPLFPELPTTRLFEILDVWYGRSAGGLVFDMTMPIAWNDALWLAIKQAPLTTKETSTRPVDLAALMIEERVREDLNRAAKRVASIPELSGAVFRGGITQDLSTGKRNSFMTIAIPAGPLARYHAGKIKERALFEKATITLVDPNGDEHLVRVPPDRITETR